MTDLLLCELLGTRSRFVGDLCQTLGIENIQEVLSVRRSVHETSLGETDVEAIVAASSKRVGLLIENKVRALLMPDQMGRYRRRGEEGKMKGLWESYLVVMFSPAGYRSYMTADDLSVVDGFISYEWVRQWLEQNDSVESAFKMHMLDEAIKDARTGYVKRADSRMTHFHQSVHRIASVEYPQLKMAWLEQAGYDSSIIHLPYALPARGDSLLMKVKMGTAEMRVETRDPIGAERALNALVPDDWRTTRAKGYAGVEIAVGTLDATQDFNIIEPHVRRFLKALADLHDFYHLADVSDVVEGNRGERPSRSKMKVS
jgi:hypothetical protein